MYLIRGIFNTYINVINTCRKSYEYEYVYFIKLYDRKSGINTAINLKI